MTPGLHTLWPTPIGIHRWDQAEAANPLLARVFAAMRATATLDADFGAHSDRAATSPATASEPPPFYASGDDLLQRVRLPEWDGFVRFIVGALRETVTAANAGAWPAAQAAQGLPLKLAINGLWFQISNRGAFHDVHTHGNCSWSAVYCVQVDDEADRIAHPVHGAANGVTRFYGPHFQHLGGAHVDLGNAYLQPPHVDVAPVPGQLVLFPAWLPHQAMPYAGARDRIIVSFNASVHAAEGSDQLHSYAGR